MTKCSGGKCPENATHVLTLPRMEALGTEPAVAEIKFLLCPEHLTYAVQMGKRAAVLATVLIGDAEKAVEAFKVSIEKIPGATN